MPEFHTQLLPNCHEAQRCSAASSEEATLSTTLFGEAAAVRVAARDQAWIPCLGA